MLAFAWIVLIIAGFYLLCMICKLKALRVAIAVIETAADYFADTKRILFVPMIYFVLAILFLAAWIIAVICVASIGPITVTSVETQNKDIEWDSHTTWAMWYMFFGCVWIVFFIVSCNEFVVIISAITWYYSDKTVPDDDGIPGDSDVHTGFWWTYRYHMGSLAMGSFLLAVVWILKVIFEYIGEKMHEAVGGNGCTKCLIACMACCIDCFDRFVRYLTKNAYIYMALSGEGFCSSALNAFILILKNAAKFAFVDGIADIFMFLAKLFISCATCATSWPILNAMDESSEVDEIWWPLMLIFFITYLISHSFIAIFEVSSNTILQCYLLDKEIAGQMGVPDPDHIPPTLAKFFGDHVVEQQARDIEAHKRSLSQSGDKENLI